MNFLQSRRWVALAGMSLPYACDGRAKNTSGATRVQERAFTADSTPLPVGFRLSGAVSTRDGLLLWGRKSDSLILWPRGAAVQMFVGNRLFSGVVGVAERAPGVLEILDTIAGVGSEREISVGRMRATRSFTRVHGIESAAFASGQWRAVRPNADSSFSFIDPLIAEGELFRYRSPASAAVRPRVDRAVVVGIGTHHIVALRFYPYRLFKVSLSGEVLDSITPTLRVTHVQIIGLDWVLGAGVEVSSSTVHRPNRCGCGLGLSDLIACAHLIRRARMRSFKSFHTEAFICVATYLQPERLCRAKRHRNRAPKGAGHPNAAAPARARETVHRRALQHADRICGYCFARKGRTGVCTRSAKQRHTRRRRCNTGETALTCRTRAWRDAAAESHGVSLRFDCVARCVTRARHPLSLKRHVRAYRRGFDRTRAGLLWRRSGGVWPFGTSHDRVERPRQRSIFWDGQRRRTVSAPSWKHQARHTGASDPGGHQNERAGASPRSADEHATRAAICRHPDVGFRARGRRRGRARYSRTQRECRHAAYTSMEQRRSSRTNLY